MKWITQNIKKWMQNGCNNEEKIHISVLELYITYSFTTLEEINKASFIEKILMYIFNFTIIPKEIDKLINLQLLLISFNHKLTTLPKEIGNLINLHELYLNTNYLKIIPAELGNLINLQVLHLHNNKLTTIPDEIGNLINLKILDLHNNKITKIPNKIGNLINLKILDLSRNNLNTLPKKIGYLINLQKLNLSINNLNTLPKKICNLINLQELYLCNNNNLKIPAGLKVKTNCFNLLPKKIYKLINLFVLTINNNNLSTIPAKIFNLINLQELYLANNNLTTIPARICDLINLQKLYVSNNNLTTIPVEITYIRNIKVYYNNNPIEYIPPQVIRYIERNKTIQKIYNDNQSVHNHSIQEGIKNSINYIMSIKPIYKLDNLNNVIIDNNFINNQTKTILFEYINCKDVHITLNVTFAELLINVLSFIDQHEFKNEIYKVLEQEMKDTICKCFTGRISRLINCLNGFDDHIIINISNTEQIGNIIILIKDKLLSENNYSIELHKDIVMKELYDRGYEKNVIDEWIDYI
jgi:Leucine-rich repeat (LRR) protein